jgi:hypothetical protein
MQVRDDCATVSVSPCGRFSHTFTPCRSTSNQLPRPAFTVLPRRWVVARTFAWWGHSRRRNKAYERVCTSMDASMRAETTPSCASFPRFCSHEVVDVNATPRHQLPRRGNLLRCFPHSPKRCHTISLSPRCAPWAVQRTVTMSLPAHTGSKSTCSSGNAVRERGRSRPRPTPPAASGKTSSVATVIIDDGQVFRRAS